MSHTSTLRTRRTLSGVLAAALASVGLVATGLGLSPASAVAASVAVTTNPSPVTPSAENSFTVTITNGDVAVIKSARISLPAGLTGINAVAVSNSGWTQQTVGSVINVATSSNATQVPNGGTLTVTFKATTPATGTLAIGVQTWANDNQNGPGTSVSGGSVTVGKLDQTIIFGALGGKTYGDADFGVSASASSGLAVSFTASGDCTVSGSTVHITGAGHCDITAKQAGNGSYNAAPDVTRGFDIAKANQTISITPIDPQTYAAGATVNVVAAATSGLPVTLTVDSGPCNVSGLTITLTGAGVCAFTGTQGGSTNYNAASPVPSSFTINKGAATIDVSGDTVTYDGQPHGVTAATTPAGLGTLTYTYNGSSTEPTDAGTYEVKVNLVNDNYEATEQTVTLVIDPRPVTADFTVASRDYDGSTEATVTGCTLPGEPDGVLDGDSVGIDCSAATATFDSKNIGTRTATIGGTYGLTGAGSGNYTLTGFNSATGVISAATVYATIQVGDKNYDCTTAVDSASVDVTFVGTVYGSDEVIIGLSDIRFDSATVGDNHTVTADLSLSGSGSGNYALSSTTTTDSPVQILPRPLVASFTAANKVYDGTDAATVTPGALSDTVCSEDVTLSVTGAQFIPDGDAGTGKTVTGTFVLGGADAGNYVVAIGSVNTALADITKRPVAGSFTADDKVWDGNTQATIATRSLGAVAGDANSGPVSGDDVSLTGGLASFADPNVGSGKTVTVPTGVNGFTLSGADTTNYSLAAGPWTTTASITALYSGKGFFQPVDMPVGSTVVWNSIKGGQTVPLKFEIFNAAGTVEQTSMSVFGVNPFSFKEVTCGSGAAPTDAIEEFTSTGSTTLRYDTTGGQYIQNWKTPTVVGKCYSVTVKTVDGTTVGPAYFKINK